MRKSRPRSGSGAESSRRNNQPGLSATAALAGQHEYNSVHNESTRQAVYDGQTFIGIAVVAAGNGLGSFSDRAAAAFAIGAAARTAPGRSR